MPTSFSGGRQGYEMRQGDEKCEIKKKVVYGGCQIILTSDYVTQGPTTYVHLVNTTNDNNTKKDTVHLHPKMFTWQSSLISRMAAKSDQ